MKVAIIAIIAALCLFAAFFLALVARAQVSPSPIGTPVWSPIVPPLATPSRTPTANPT